MKYSCKFIVQKIIYALLSHFGTLILIILYLIGGGFLFQLLELQNEVNACRTSYKILVQKLNDTTLRGMAIGSAGHNTSIYYQQLYSMLMEFSKDVFTLNVSPNKDCETLGQPGNMPNWNLANAIFFCATIVTTIGYGNITPATMWGRIVCIIYAFVGIPLMLLFLGNFGEILAMAFRSLYMNLCCCLCFIKRKPPIAVDNNEINDVDENNFHLVANESQADLKSTAPPKMVMTTQPIKIVDIDEEDKNDEVTIPVTIVTSVLLLYMYLGAVIFKIWESWDLVAAMYFSFITVSTIGFGDLYPAKDTIATGSATVELLIGALYCVIGLAMLSMCLSLIKDELVGKFEWLGEKIGLTNKNNSNPDDSEEFNQYEDNPTDVVKVSSTPRIARYSNEAFERDFDASQLNSKMKSA